MPPPAAQPRLEVGHIVRLRLTEQESLTHHRTHIVCRVHELSYTQRFVLLLSEWGVITDWFLATRLAAVQDPLVLFNPVKGAQCESLDLKTALMKDAGYGFREGTLTCVCSTKCRSRYCPCYRAGRACGGECHVYHPRGRSETCSNLDV